MDKEYGMRPTQTVALKEVDSVEIVSLIARVPSLGLELRAWVSNGREEAAF